MSRVARLLNPVVWRLPGRAARKLFSFAVAEHGSMIDLMQAARGTPSAERAALYLRHAGDEARHARLFATRSAELRHDRDKPSLGHPRADSEALYDRLGEVDFLAFVHRGERRGRAQFITYRDYFARTGRDRERALFAAIIADEERHEAYTYDLLVALSGGERPARAALRRVARWEAWRTWRRAGRGLANALYVALMTALYVATAPMAVIVRLARPVRTGWQRPRAHDGALALPAAPGERGDPGPDEPPDTAHASRSTARRAM